MRVISRDLVRKLLPMNECVEVMARAFEDASAGRAVVPSRQHTLIPGGRGQLLTMPCATSGVDSYGAKLVSVHPDNAGAGLPTIQGVVILFDRLTGAPKAIIDGAEISAIRTAAGSGIATRLLARADASTCGILGAGVQASSHIDAMCAVRPIREVRIWARDPDKAQAFVNGQSLRPGCRVKVVADPAEAAACDIVCAVTGSSRPVVRASMVRPGAHINLVGSHTPDSREADSLLIKRSAVYVDLMAAARLEAGDLLIPESEGLIENDHIGKKKKKRR